MAAALYNTIIIMPVMRRSLRLMKFLRCAANLIVQAENLAQKNQDFKKQTPAMTIETPLLTVYMRYVVTEKSSTKLYLRSSIESISVGMGSAYDLAEKENRSPKYVKPILPEGVLRKADRIHPHKKAYNK